MYDLEFRRLRAARVAQSGSADGGDEKETGELTNLVQVRVHRCRKITWFRDEGLGVRLGEQVVVETERGTAGGVVLGNPLKKIVDPRNVRSVLRVLGKGSMKANRERCVSRESQAWKVCSDLVSNLQLDMKLVGVEYVFWENRTVFYFVAEGRVDFRELVKELSRLLRCRVEMRQIGPRDETKMLGGIGRCGRELCCSTFLDEFRSVRTKMAKEQGLVVNQEKITGHCRKLLCCLAYERATYSALRAELPPIGATVETEDGPAKVLDVQVLRRTVKLSYANKPEVVRDVPVASIRFEASGRGDAAGLLGPGDDADFDAGDIEDDDDAPAAVFGDDEPRADERGPRGDDREHSRTRGGRENDRTGGRGNSGGPMGNQRDQRPAGERDGQQRRDGRRDHSGGGRDGPRDSGSRDRPAQGDQRGRDRRDNRPDSRGPRDGRPTGENSNQRSVRPDRNRLQARDDKPRDSGSDPTVVDAQDGNSEDRG